MGYAVKMPTRMKTRKRLTITGEEGGGYIDKHRQEIRNCDGIDNYFQRGSNI